MSDDDRAALPMWVIYDHPADYPDAYVARKWLTLPKQRPTNELLVATDLEVIRTELEARGLVCLARQDGDTPIIIETWI
jgi:hypothetical protein